MALITIASAPKPFKNPHIATIQRNAIQSWVSLGKEVDVLLVGDESGIAEIAAEIGVSHTKDVVKNESGTPLVSSIFKQMRQHGDSPILLYVNADILLLPDMVNAVHIIVEQSEKFLGIGQRWDLDLQTQFDFCEGWSDRLAQENRERGLLHAPVGSDYFVFPRTVFSEIPDFAIGRAGWDNWMIFEARQRGWKVVDLTSTVTVIHQNHDYSHLPGGQPHYQLPETFENTRLAGGRRVIFTLRDADYSIQDKSIKPIPLQGQRLLREMEILPLVRLHSRWLGEVFFAVFHPIKAWREWWARLTYKLKHLIERK